MTAWVQLNDLAHEMGHAYYTTLWGQYAANDAENVDSMPSELPDGDGRFGEYFASFYHDKIMQELKVAGIVESTLPEFLKDSLDTQPGEEEGKLENLEAQVRAGEPEYQDLGQEIGNL
jgi:hypothetical protein